MFGSHVILTDYNNRRFGMVDNTGDHMATVDLTDASNCSTFFVLQSSQQKLVFCNIL